MTLQEYYKSIGKPLPSLAERKKIAESLGIKNYTGTVEQNNQLLSSLNKSTPQSGFNNQNPFGALSTKNMSTTTPQMINPINQNFSNTSNKNPHIITVNGITYDTSLSGGGKVISGQPTQTNTSQPTPSRLGTMLNVAPQPTNKGGYVAPASSSNYVPPVQQPTQTQPTQATTGGVPQGFTINKDGNYVNSQGQVFTMPTTGQTTNPEWSSGDPQLLRNILQDPSLDGGIRNYIEGVLATGDSKLISEALANPYIGRNKNLTPEAMQRTYNYNYGELTPAYNNQLTLDTTGLENALTRERRNYDSETNNLNLQSRKDFRDFEQEQGKSGSFLSGLRSQKIEEFKSGYQNKFNQLYNNTNFNLRNDLLGYSSKYGSDLTPSIALNRFDPNIDAGRDYSAQRETNVVSSPTGLLNNADIARRNQAQTLTNNLLEKMYPKTTIGTNL